MIGDTLYSFKDEVVKKTNIIDGSTEEASLYYILPEDPGGGGGGGGGGAPSSPCDGYNDPTGIKVGDRFFIDEVVTDELGGVWDIRLTYGNAAYTDSYFIRRSRTFTMFTFLEHNPEYRGHFYQGSYLIQYTPPDLPSYASIRFPNSYVSANMEYSSRQFLEFSCHTRRRGDSGEFRADRTKARCPNTGVVSWHNAKLGDQVFLDDVCVE